MRYLLAFSAFFLFQRSVAQTMESPVAPTPYKDRANAYAQREKMDANSIVSNVKFHCVGPTIMSGRVVDIDVSPNDPTHFYVGYASGGLWKTVNNGQSFTPVFDDQESFGIGDFAVDWKNNETIWVGTGENNSSRSSYSGTGMFMSKDGGKTWEHKGLEETHHIGKVIISPDDPNTIWVAAIGHLFSPNKERGVFKTTDGGKTWKQVLYKDDNTGAIDLQVDPTNSKILYATLWHRERRAWNFVESGNTSGIYKSTDGGEKWEQVSNAGSGFPVSNGTGRIGLTIFPKNTNIIYAVFDNQDPRKEEKKSEDMVTKDKLKKISNADFLALGNKDLNKFLDENDFPDKYDAEKVKEMVKDGKLKPSQLAEFLEDANSLLFDTPIIGPEVYRSDDAGKTWKKQNSDFIDELYFTYGYYFGRIWVSPTDENKIYLAGLFPLRSDDGGKTFRRLYSGNVHADHHAMWLDPNRDGHIINGNDGGINISYDDGKTWFKANTPPVGQFYSVNYDMEEPYNVYGGLQDNGVWTGSSQTDPTEMGWYQEGQNPFKSIMGGDGMQVQVDTRDNATVYTGYQYGNYFRVNKNTGEQKYITPRHDLGEHPYRWNWQAPILISKFNKDIIYFGSNHFHRSMNKGDDFKTFPEDLTNGGKKGDVAYGTLTCIDESPTRFGLLYCGSDDGAIHVSKDDGNSWTKIVNGLPQYMWVRRITASMYDEGTVYVCLNGHTWDHFNSYLYVSHNYGSTWEKIGNDLPMEAVNVVKEDPVNPNILYVGTDYGVYVSFDKGKSFMRMSNGLPTVAVHDLCIQPRDRDLIVGTHGRSIYIASVTELEQLQDSILAKALYVFDLPETKYHGNWGKKPGPWDEPNKPEYKIPFYIKNPGKVKIEIQTAKGITLFSTTEDMKKGLNYYSYDLSIDASNATAYEKALNDAREKNEDEIKVEKKDSGKYYMQAGKYTVIITDQGSGTSMKKDLVITKPKNHQRTRTSPQERE